MPAELVSRLPDDGTWLIVSDDAEVIARRVFDSVQALKSTDRKNVQFLLCCRDTDWKAAEVEHLAWNEDAIFVTEALRGLTKADAEKVVSAWRLYGKEGLKTLDGLQLDNAASQLLTAAKSEETNSGEGSFFGAVLQVRWGEGLKSHIDNLLRKLEKRPIIGGKTLLDAFAYISAMHAENLQILSKEVLARVLKIPNNDLKKRILGPLGEEAAIATTGQMVFTRHRAIADMAVRILAEKFTIDFDNLYLELAQSARQTYLAGIYIPNPGEWRYLSSYFFDRGNQALGIRLAHAMLEIEPGDPYLTVKLAQLYRKAGHSEQSVQVFRSAPVITQRHRGFYSEWGTTEGTAGNHALSIWLLAFSLADGTTRHPPENNQAKLSLNGLSIAFAELHKKYNNTIFIEACGASAQLWLANNSDSSYEPQVKRLKKLAKENGVDDMSPRSALDCIQVAVVAAWEQREEELPDWVIPGNQLTFNGLARLLRIT